MHQKSQGNGKNVRITQAAPIEAENRQYGQHRLDRGVALPKFIVDLLFQSRASMKQGV